jgi:hypothetical protein
MGATGSHAGSKAISSADVAELAWSILLTVQYVEVADDSLTNAAKMLLERLGAGEDWEPRPPDEEYMLAFALGLKILAGFPVHEIDALEQQVRARQSGRSFGPYWDWGMRIDGFGGAPAANRNRAAAPPGAIDSVNDSALGRWPELRRES